MQAVGGSETVLVVDDEIRPYGYTVIGAAGVDSTHNLSDQEAGDGGFSAAQNTVWLHGGTISVANGSGSGSCCTLTLPIFPTNNFDGGEGGE